MPRVKEIRCDNCGLPLPSGWGGRFYVSTSLGERIVCPHPGEFEHVAQVLGLSPDEKNDLLSEPKWHWGSSGKERRKRIKDAYDQRTGFLSDCFCEACGNTTSLNLDLDERVCGECGATCVYSVKEMCGRKCLRCNDGYFKEYETGVVS